MTLVLLIGLDVHLWCIFVFSRSFYYTQYNDRLLASYGLLSVRLSVSFFIVDIGCDEYPTAKEYEQMNILEVPTYKGKRVKVLYSR